MTILYDLLVETFAELLQSARSNKRVIGAFTCYDLWQLTGILSGANEVGAPVIILVSPALISRDRGRTLVAIQAFMRESEARAILQADHVVSMEDVRTAWRCGVNAVLADGSRLALEENAHFSALAREVASAWSQPEIGIEAELGRVEGDEDRVSARQHGRLTNPEDVPGFLVQSRADCLAVSVGNRHGTYSEPPDLDWDLLDELNRVSSVPLSLHGASGLSADDIRRARSFGVAKMNFNTELRKCYFETVDTLAPQLHETLDLVALGDGIAEATSTLVASKLQQLGWAP